MACYTSEVCGLRMHPCADADPQLFSVSALNKLSCGLRTLGPSNDFTLLNGWICLHGVLA